MKLNKMIMLAMLPIALLLQSCKKQLDAKPDKKLAIPSTLVDLQALLDHTPSTTVEPGADEASADNYYITDASYNALPMSQSRAIYAWEPANQFDGISSDWGVIYKKVYYCNTVLDALKDIAPTDQLGWNNIKGQALMKRAKSFWHIAVVWSLAYDPATAANDLGIPLRLNSDFNEQSVRASVEQTYAQIISDLKASIPLLPVIPLHPVRPSKPAAYAMLSRVYLSMRNYEQAKIYADSSLSLFPSLLDYNTLNPAAAFPFSNPNAETIFGASAGSSLLIPTRAVIDSNLYSSYAATDLRKTLFFKSLGNGTFSFKGSYMGTDSHFSGLASSELYLTRAECNARAGRTTEALADLNTLLVKRYKSGSFVPVTAATSTQALAIILTERRKEMIFRFTRWMDIKRLNKEGANITLKRLIGGVTYSLPPNDLRYALALPEDIIALSGMPQNPR
jgi:tetratricopeptide (TPR) repeat protein